MLKYDQFLLESVETFSNIYDFFRDKYKEKVKQIVISSLKEIVGNFKIDEIQPEDVSVFLIAHIETEDEFEIFISFNSTYRKIEYFIIDKMIDDTISNNKTFAQINTFSKDLKKHLEYLRSNEYKSKRGIEKFNL